MDEKEARGGTGEKIYTEAEFNAKLDELLSRKIARREAKLRREYESKYGEQAPAGPDPEPREAPAADSGSGEFQAFAEKFNPDVPLEEIYGIYDKMQPKKEVRTMGSLKNSLSQDSGVKDFYTKEEALRFTRKDFDQNPALFRAVEASMAKW